MTETTHLPTPSYDPQVTLFRTATGTRVHLPECPHLLGTDPHPASASERLQHPLCDWSRAQVGGFGREHFDDVEGAVRRVGVPVEAHDAVLDALRFVEHDEVWVVHSLTYGALGREGRAVAGFGKTYYWVGDRRVNLPSYVESSRSGYHERGPYGEPCPVCHVTLPLTGVCDDC